MDMTFFRAALLGACVLLSGCDSATTPASTATVLDGKTMGTFWRVSVIGVDEAKAEALRAKVQAQLDADDRLLSTWKNDSALMRFNHAADTQPWPVSEAMADIVTCRCGLAPKRTARWILPWGRWSICGALARNNSRFKFRARNRSMR